MASFGLHSQTVAMCQCTGGTPPNQPADQNSLTEVPVENTFHFYKCVVSLVRVNPNIFLHWSYG